MGSRKILKLSRGSVCKETFSSSCQIHNVECAIYEKLADVDDLPKLKVYASHPFSKGSSIVVLLSCLFDHPFKCIWTSKAHYMLRESEQWLPPHGICWKPHQHGQRKLPRRGCHSSGYLSSFPNKRLSRFSKLWQSITLAHCCSTKKRKKNSRLVLLKTFSEPCWLQQ